MPVKVSRSVRGDLIDRLQALRVASPSDYERGYIDATLAGGSWLTVDMLRHAVGTINRSRAARGVKPA